jgi:hypothetical protein
MENSIAQKKEEAPEYIGQIIKDGFYDPLVLIGFPYD